MGLRVNIPHAIMNQAFRQCSHGHPQINKKLALTYCAFTHRFWTPAHIKAYADNIAKLYRR